MTQNYKEFKMTIGGKEVIVETGKYAEQANGACIVRCGETAVLSIKDLTSSSTFSGLVVTLPPTSFGSFL